MPRIRRSSEASAREQEATTDDDQEFDNHPIYQCKACAYQSERRFNVLRHERRIHVKAIRRECCGRKFRTKGDWYKHCESSHPERREASLLAKLKYKMSREINVCKRKPRNSNSTGDSDTSQSTDASLSPPVERRCSVRIREETLKKIQEQLESSDDNEDTTEAPGSHPSSDDESTITASTDPNCPPEKQVDELEDCEETPYIECQFVLSDYLGMDAFIEQLPLNPLDEPDQNFPQYPENPERISGDLCSNQGIHSEGDTPGVLQEDQVRLALQEMTQNVICNNNCDASVSFSSSLLSDMQNPQETDSNCNHILQEYQENQLPPKKMILKKFLVRSKMDEAREDKENAIPGGPNFLGETVAVEQVHFPWNELTLIQRNFLGLIDFERYKV